MKAIGDLLLEGEQLRLETDDLGPQDEIEYWKGKAGMIVKRTRRRLKQWIIIYHYIAHLTLLVDQMMAMPTKMTLVTLR